MMIYAWRIVLILCWMAPIGCAPENRADLPSTADELPYPPDEGAWTETEAGLKMRDLETGTGAQPRPGRRVRIHYTTWLASGRKIEGSVDRGRPFEFTPGRGQAIAGWEEALATMREGGRRAVVVPPELGFGPYPGADPELAQSTLVFEIALLEVTKKEAPSEAKR